MCGAHSLVSTEVAPRPPVPDSDDSTPRLWRHAGHACARRARWCAMRGGAEGCDALAPGALLPPPIELHRGPSPWPILLQGTALLAWWVGATAACVGINRDDPALIYAATMVVAVGLVAFDLSRQKQGGVTCMTVFSLIAVATAFANLVGIGEHGGPTTTSTSFTRPMSICPSRQVSGWRLRSCR